MPELTLIFNIGSDTTL